MRQYVSRPINIIPDVISTTGNTCMTSADQDIKCRLSTEGKFYLGLNYRSEETCDPSSRPCKQNAATWKLLTMTGGDDKLNQRSLCVDVGLG